MRNYENYIGGTFTRLKVIDFIKEDKPMFICECSCGTITNKVVYDVLRGFIQSCGCLQSEKIKENGHKNLKPGVEIGSKFINKKGREYEVVEYIRSHKVKVRFTESGYEKWTATKEIKACCVVDDSMVEVDRKPKAEKERTRKVLEPKVKVGQKFSSKVGETYEVIAINGIYCTIRFLDEFSYTTEVKISDARRGVRNPFRKCYSGVGYLGIGEFTPTKDKQIFSIWSNMLVRCYEESLRQYNKTYSDCYVNDKWHCFQNFAKWATIQFHAIENLNWYLDKDILVRGNKEYGPDTCCFVPVEINNLFTLRGACRGQYPVGVHFSKKNGKFAAQINKNGKRVGLGYFGSVIEAFNAYKKAKEEGVKEIAEKYKGQIDDRVYSALINWTVSEDD